MKRLLSFALLPLLCAGLVKAQSSACPLGAEFERIAPKAGVPGSGACVYYRTLPHKSYSRSYKLLVPDSYQPSAAKDRLVLDFHGYGHHAITTLLHTIDPLDTHPTPPPELPRLVIRASTAPPPSP